MQGYFERLTGDEELIHLHSELLKRINDLAAEMQEEYETFNRSDTLASISKTLERTSKSLKKCNNFEVFIQKLLLDNNSLTSQLKFHTPLNEFFKTPQIIKNLMVEQLALDDAYNGLNIGSLQKTFGANYDNKNILNEALLNENSSHILKENLVVASFTTANHENDNFQNELKLVKELYLFVVSNNLEEKYADDEHGLFFLNHSFQYVYNIFLNLYFSGEILNDHPSPITLILRDEKMLFELFNRFTVRDMLTLIPLLHVRLKNITLIDDKDKISDCFDLYDFMKSYDESMPMEWNVELLDF